MVWIDNLALLPGYSSLSRSLSGEGLTLVCADQSIGRYLDLYVLTNE